MIGIWHNAREIEGISAMTIEGDCVRVEAVPGSMLDGYLGWQAARGSRPRLGLRRDGDDKARIHRRCAVTRTGEGQYTLEPDGAIES